MDPILVAKIFVFIVLFEYGFSEGDVKKHTRGDRGFVNNKSYFTYPNGSDMSLDDVYNIQVEAMNKVTKDVWDGKMNGGLAWPIDLGKIIGMDTRGGKYSSILCIVRNAEGYTHAYHCDKKIN